MCCLLSFLNLKAKVLVRQKIYIMSRTTDIYSLVGYEQGDKVYPYYDWRNNQTIENEIAGLFLFFGQGILSGWDVQQMVGGNYSTAIQEELDVDKQFLLSEYDRAKDSYWGVQFNKLGLTPTIPTVSTGLVPKITLASTTALTLSGAQTVDGVSVHNGDYILVKNQTLAKDNGIYIANLSGDWTKLPLTDGGSGAWVNPNINRIQICRVQSGNINANTLFALAPYTGLTPLTPDFIFFDPWKQVIRVTTGTGTVGLFRARTEQKAYFRLTQSNIFYVWAEASLCLATDGLATITCPLDPQSDYDNYHTATYLADVSTLPDYTNAPYIRVDSVKYENRRNNLENLAGALQESLRKSFYKHVHLGGTDHPSKIQLATKRILDCTAPVGSTILSVGFSTTDSKIATDYGIPEVRLNNVILPESTYRLSFSEARIYLKNSLKPGDRVQLYLPLAPQIVAFASSGDFSTSIVITDGTKDTNGNYVPFLWDAGDYTEISVFLQTTLIDPTLYTLDGLTGLFSLVNSNSAAGFTTADLKIIFTKVSINRQITGKLSNSRIGSVDASSFTTGTIDPRRLTTFSHVGQFRIRELATLRPVLRLFPGSADHTIFYPEIVGSPVQYDTDFYTASISANLNPNYVFGTKRGLLQSASSYLLQSLNQLSDAVSAPAWNIDNGRPVQVMDEILDAEGGGNHFKITYVRTAEGKLFYTDNSGTTWKQRKLPSVSQVIEIDGVETAISVTPLVTSFWCSSQRTEVETPSLIVKNEWYSYLYLGTNYGLWTAEIKEGTPEDEWSWNQTNFWKSHQTTVRSITEIVTFGVETTDDGGSTEWYDRTLYVGSDLGFYAGTSTRNSLADNITTSRKVITDANVIGLYWVKNGFNENNLIFYTNYEAFIVHDSKALEISGSTTTTRYWAHPFHSLLPLSTDVNRFVDVVAATTENITLSGLQTIDGYSLSSGDHVLVRLQTDKTKNGIYSVNSGSWSRISSPALSTSLWVRVISGNIGENAGSIWLIKLGDSGSYAWGSNEVNWTPLWFRLEKRTDDTTINSLTEIEGTNIFAFCHTGGIEFVVDPYDEIHLVHLAPVQRQPNNVVWNITRQGSPAQLFYLYDASVSRYVLIVLSSNGIWRSNDNGATWSRHIFEFMSPTGWNPSVYDSISQELISNSLFNVSKSDQSFTFTVARNLYDSFVYERDYQDYYVAPWINDATTEVVVEVNDLAPVVQYALYPNEGRIHFISGLQKSDVVRISITRIGAFLKDVGTIPHGEQPHVYIVSENILTTLAADLPPGDTAPALTLTVADASAIPVTAKYLELRSGTDRQRISVSIDANTRVIRLITPRPLTDITFPADRTKIYLVTQGSVLGIEDRLTKATSNQPYHLHSVSGANIQALALASRTEFPSIFSNFTGDVNGQYKEQEDRGQKSALFYDSTYDKLDDRASSSTLFTGFEPIKSAPPTTPKVIYSIYGNPTSPTGMKVGTDQGIWNYDGTRWKKESDLGGATHVYFLKIIDGLLSAGTEKGLWQKSSTNVWSINPAYPQAMYSHATFTWGEIQDEKGNVTTAGVTASAFGKSDGIAFVRPNSDGTFTSDHFDAVDNKRIYGLFHGKFFREKDNGADNPPTITKVDGLYLCTEDGLYGLCDGDTTGRNKKYAAFLTGREMYGMDRLSNIVKLPSGGTVCSPMKIYGIFQAPLIPPQKEVILIFVLTSNGIYRVRNWRHCDPAITGGLTFSNEKRHLDGQRCNTTDTPSEFVGRSCYCFLGISGKVNPIDTDNRAKLFIGTDHGVYRSFDQGDNWDRCERMGNSDVAVYSLVVAGDCILAGTDTGFWYTYDDGDNWLRPDVAPPTGGQCINFAPTVTGSISFDGGYLAQNFIPVGGSNRVKKVSLYLSRKELASDDPARIASLDNTLDVAIYNTVSSIPNTLIASATISNASLDYSETYKATIDWNRATRLYDKQVFDDTIYYSVLGVSSSNTGSVGISGRYTLQSAGHVDQIKARIYYTQQLEVAFEYWDGSAWQNGLTQAFSFPNNAGSGQWVNVETNKIVTTTATIWRLSARDVFITDAGIKRQVRLGSFEMSYLTTPYRLEEILTAADIRYPGFRSFDLSVTLPDTISTYALVTKENIAPGGVSVLQWLAADTV